MPIPSFHTFSRTYRSDPTERRSIATRIMKQAMDEYWPNDVIALHLLHLGCRVQFVPVEGSNRPMLLWTEFASYRQQEVYAAHGGPEQGGN